MATQAANKNKIIQVPVSDTNGNKYTAKVSSSGPDVGKILLVVDSTGSSVPFNTATNIYLGNKTAWDNNINSNLKASNTGIPGSSPKSSGFTPEKNYSIQANSNNTSISNNETNLQSADALNQAIAAQTNISSPPSTSGKYYVFPEDLGVGKNSTEGEPQDYIRIGAVKYTPPQSGFLENVPKSNPSTQSILKTGIASLNQTLPKNMEFQGEIILPMPLEIRDAARAEWGISNFSAVNAAMIGNVQGLYDIPAIGDAAALGNLLGVGGNEVAAGALANTYLSAGPDASAQLRADLISSIVNRVGQNVNPADILTRSTGKTVNPNAELLFRAPSLRVFEFAWKLIPRSENEAKTIRKMIRFMKINMLPSIPKGGAVLLQTPNVFVIRFSRSDGSLNPSLPKPKLCALTQIQANHTPDGSGWSSYEDSHPIATVLTMGFAELTPVFANEYNGTSEDDVGI